MSQVNRLKIEQPRAGQNNFHFEGGCQNLQKDRLRVEIYFEIKSFSRPVQNKI